MKQLFIAVITALMMSSCILVEQVNTKPIASITLDLYLEGCHTKTVVVNTYKGSQLVLGRDNTLYLFSKWKGYRRVIQRNVVDYKIHQ